MIKAIDHIGIMTKDLQKSVEFYTDVLGFSISNKIEMAEVGLSAIFIEKNRSKIELMGYRAKSQSAQRVLKLNWVEVRFP
jgi:catechol 2,3-dioxygenase-like lactoylglutathione lyase family enzyme